MRKFLSSQKDTHPRTDWEGQFECVFTGMHSAIAFKFRLRPNRRKVLRQHSLQLLAERQQFPTEGYLFDSGFPGSISIRGKGSKLSVAISLVLYADPVKEGNAKLLFVRRDEKYYLPEVWSVLDKRVVIAEFEHR
jgi:hypothetical protein